LQRRWRSAAKRRPRDIFVETTTKQIFTPVGAACSGNHSSNVRAGDAAPDGAWDFSRVGSTKMPPPERRSTGDYFSSAARWVKVSPDTPELRPAIRSLLLELNLQTKPSNNNFAP
jgi:hypothetical protein